VPKSRRGDIVIVAGGVYSNKPRPAVILQDDFFMETDSVTVCPLTTTNVDAPLLRLAVAADATTGLDEASFMMIDKITTIRRSNVGELIGQLDAVQMLELERRILVFLGLAH